MGRSIATPIGLCATATNGLYRLTKCEAMGQSTKLTAIKGGLSVLNERRRLAGLTR
ncbi:MAG: hypothetical protein MI923_03815 [Phycisphaerales bacterium]|nr:hypothetical protein [Phycisphaerales bacterium]